MDTIDQVSSIPPTGLSNFRFVIESLLELLDLAQNDEYGILRPTEYAFRTAMKFVVATYDSMGDSFPRCSTGTNDQGGIRLAWQNVNADRRVRLFCPHSSDEEVYIYYQKSEVYGSETVTSVATLIRILSDYLS
jgi:hypothetical protein